MTSDNAVITPAAPPAVQEPRVSDDEAAPLVMSDSLFATLGKMIHILENCQGGTFDKGTKPIDLNRVMDDLRLASALLRNMHTKLGNARATIASQAEALAATKAENARLNIELDLALKAVMENQAALKAAREDKDGAYNERNRVVAALARLFPSGRTRTDIPGWDPEWHGCVYIDLPTGQVSWHYHDREAHLFAELPEYAGTWDGHDTPEKYRRLAAALKEGK